MDNNEQEKPLNRQASVEGGYWLSYGNVTHAEAARLHALSYRVCPERVFTRESGDTSKVWEHDAREKPRDIVITPIRGDRD